MTIPFAPDLARGEDNLIFYTRHDVENWYRSFNVALDLLPSTLAEFRAVMGNNRDYQFTLMPPRNQEELTQWDDLFGVEPPLPPVVGAFNPALLQPVLFFVCVAFGSCLFGAFTDSFEKGWF
jgi:hypothetical protein